MAVGKFIAILFICFATLGTARAQLIGFRLGINSGVYINEFGTSDVPHPDVLAATPALSTQKYAPLATLGAEAEILFQVSPMSHIGVELEYSKLKGYNDNPPVYNYYLTDYYLYYQPGGEWITQPVAFNTSLFNIAVNWKHFLFEEARFKPFFKLTGVVSLVGTEFTFKHDPDPAYFDSNILYARGTSNAEQEKLPVFHFGAGLGIDYSISSRWSFQADITSTFINTDRINGVPNFTYEVADYNALLSHNNQLSLTAQVSVGLVYLIEVDSSHKGGSGKTSPNFPFYRKK